MSEFEKRLIEDAKKEYPIINNKDSMPELTREFLLDLVKKKDAWFKKWFGDFKDESEVNK